MKHEIEKDKSDRTLLTIRNFCENPKTTLSSFLSNLHLVRPFLLLDPSRRRTTQPRSDTQNLDAIAALKVVPSAPAAIVYQAELETRRRLGFLDYLRTRHIEKRYLRMPMMELREEGEVWRRLQALLGCLEGTEPMEPAETQEAHAEQAFSYLYAATSHLFAFLNSIKDPAAPLLSYTDAARMRVDEFTADFLFRNGGKIVSQAIETKRDPSKSQDTTKGQKNAPLSLPRRVQAIQSKKLVKFDDLQASKSSGAKVTLSGDQSLIGKNLAVQLGAEEGTCLDGAFFDSLNGFYAVCLPLFPQTDSIDAGFRNDPTRPPLLRRFPDYLLVLSETRPHTHQTRLYSFAYSAVPLKDRIEYLSRASGPEVESALDKLERTLSPPDGFDWFGPLPALFPLPQTSSSGSRRTGRNEDDGSGGAGGRGPRSRDDNFAGSKRPKRGGGGAHDSEQAPAGGRAGGGPQGSTLSGSIGDKLDLCGGAATLVGADGSDESKEVAGTGMSGLTEASGERSGSTSGAGGLSGRERAGLGDAELCGGGEGSGDGGGGGEGEGGGEGGMRAAAPRDVRTGYESTLVAGAAASLSRKAETTSGSLEHGGKRKARTQDPRTVQAIVLESPTHPIFLHRSPPLPRALSDSPPPLRRRAEPNMAKVVPEPAVERTPTLEAINLKIVDLLGSGTFGKVFSVRSASGDLFALKIAEDDAQAREEIQNEARMYPQFRPHDLAPAFFGFFEDEDSGTAVLLLEDAGRAVKAVEELTQGERLLLLKRNEQLHALGYSHNDLEVRNVLLDKRTGDVKLIDFGRTDTHDCPGKEECPGLQAVREWLEL
ncbi:hypothetical protein JCM10207_009169 [Rhodosporidiobolus poonsookiae]